MEADREYAVIYEYACEGKYGLPTKMLPDMPVNNLEYTKNILVQLLNVEDMSIYDMIDITFMDTAKKELGLWRSFFWTIYWWKPWYICTRHEKQS